MKNIRIIIMVVATAILTGCGTATKVPITGRTQRLMQSSKPAKRVR